jgi:hypothetical protein
MSLRLESIVHEGPRPRPRPPRRGAPYLLLLALL